MNIELQSEYVLSVFGIFITNTFLTSVLVTVVLVAFALFFYLKREERNNNVIGIIRIMVFELLKLTDTVTQNRGLSRKILPLIATFFLFIVTANLLALVPGFLGSFFIQTPSGKLPILRSPNSDLTTTVALALFSVLSIQYFSWQKLGAKGYLKRFFNFSNPVKFVLGFFEMVSESVKILSFSFRLFGNVFAGEVLLLIIAFLVPYIIPLPFMILEVFVGIIQAFIFTILTLTFIKTSTMRHLSRM
jgi:F-type H+-transporting ATPase subunit a